MEKIRRHYVFKGRVQGVGFRYKAEYAASRFGVAGGVLFARYNPVKRAHARACSRHVAHLTG